SAIAAVSIAVPLRASPYAAAGIALGSALGSYVNLLVLARGLRTRLGPLYTAAMYTGTRRIVVAAAVAGAAGWGARFVQVTWMSSLHPRYAALPILAAFGMTYLVVAWGMGSAEAARWLRRPPRLSGRGAQDAAGE
ncbi:MAG: hypothetical protein ACK5AK_10470, partial [Gemmatimonas sp.]